MKLNVDSNLLSVSSTHQKSW